MAVGDVYKCDIFYNVGSELTQNVIHLREKTACTDPVPAQAVVSALTNRWLSVYEVALFSDEIYVPLIRAIRISPTSSVPGLSILGPTTINGTGTGEPVPSASALLVSIYSNTFTARGRGRIYFPGLDSAKQNDGQIDDAALTLANTLALELIEDYTPTGFTGSWELGVWSRADATFRLVTQCFPHTNLATQRGRRNHPGIGT